MLRVRSTILPVTGSKLADAGLVGREAEVDRIEALLASAHAGGSGVLAFSGEPGIGKTALLTETRRRAGEDFSSSCVHLLTFPIPIPREVLDRCTFRLFTASMAFAPNPRARLPLVPRRGKDHGAAGFA